MQISQLPGRLFSSSWKQKKWTHPVWLRFEVGKISYAYSFMLTLKTAGVGGFNPSSADMACMPSIFIKTSQLFFVESCWISAFTKIFLGKLRMLEVGPRGRWKRSSIFQSSHPSQKNMLSKANKQKEKEDDLQDLSPKKIRKYWWKLKKWQTFF